MRIDYRWVVGALIAVAPLSGIQAAQQTVRAPIKQVTVYADMARVVRAAVVNLQPGNQTVLVENLPTNSDPGSYRVEVPGDNGVTMVNFRQEAKDYVERVSRDVSGAAKLRDSLIRQRNLINDHRAAFQAQKELLASFQGVSQQAVGQQMSEGALNVAQWEGAFRFVGQRMIEVGDSLRESDRALGDLGQRISACDGQISRAYDEIRHVGRSIFVDLQAKAPSTCTVLVSYMIAGASWTPAYDARLSPDGKLVEMTAFALISQSTGEQWDSVELVLSTSNPNSNVGPGEYRPYSLKIIEPANDIGKTITVIGTRDIIDKFATTNQVSIAQESIKRRPAQSVDEMLKSVGGVQTTSTDRVFIRGGNSGEMSYTVEGVPIGDPLGGVGRAGENLALVSGTFSWFASRRAGYLQSPSP